MSNASTANKTVNLQSSERSYSTPAFLGNATFPKGESLGNLLQLRKIKAYRRVSCKFIPVDFCMM